MGVVKVEYNEIQEVIANMKTTFGKTKSELEEIKNIIEKIKSTDIWVGDGSEYYNDKAKNIYPINEAVDVNIDKAINFLEGAIERYKLIDSQLSNMTRVKFRK